MLMVVNRLMCTVDLSPVECILLNKCTVLYGASLQVACCGGRYSQAYVYYRSERQIFAKSDSPRNVG
jgi:hypothetical protein